MVAGVLDRPRHQHLRAGCRQLEHLLERHRVELARLRHDPGVSAEDAVDVGVDLADVCVERSGHRDGRRVGAATTQRGRVGGRGDALEAGDDHDLSLLERLADAARADLDDPGLAVARVGEDPRLRAGERDRVPAEIHDRHRQQRDRDLLARGEQHVELAVVRQRRDPARELEQLVGRVAHRGDDDADLTARLGGRDHPPGDALDPRGSSDGAAAVLLHDQLRHRPGAYPRSARAYGLTWMLPPSIARCDPDEPTW